jgi:hypothetical protein
LVLLVGRLALAAAVLAASGGAVKAARSVWRVMAARPLSLVVASGNSAVLNGRRHRKVTLVGPARLDGDLGGADRIDVTLEGGSVIAEAGDETLLVEANGLGVTLPAGASGKVAGTGGAVTAVDALAGQLRLAAAANAPPIELLAGRRWPEPPAPPRLPPAPTTAATTATSVAPPAEESQAAHGASASPIRESQQDRQPDRQPDTEEGWVARAFHAVRVDGDGENALRALDERARRFPDGVLSNEARVARIEALLALGRASEALPLLLDIRDESQGLTRAIRLARAELLAERDRCREATADLDALVAADIHDDTGERALYGRAGCRLRAGDTAAARQDLRRYGDLYPGGRFIAAVRRADRELDTVAAP